MYQVDYNSYRSVKGFNRRVRFLIMHYTALDFENSIIALTGSSVSAHYLSRTLQINHMQVPVLKICAFLIWLMRMNVHGMQGSVRGPVAVI